MEERGEPWCRLPRSVVPEAVRRDAAGAGAIHFSLDVPATEFEHWYYASPRSPPDLSY
ncbi:hypothetical protein EMEDMD4_300113 [Sinorhizobium medicae]|uniref:Uncharacterized protein n=1 Tax=Sinorhizobium medicae TaxID=110321 RepID=A0A508WWD7_9HYPH|nr:hypothetical protein EMEDMD4_300113 [Sinorhizobium medicae]